MTVYYEFGLACDLKPDTPQQVLDTLAYMTGHSGEGRNDLPSHYFFQYCDWRHLLQPNRGRFPGAAGSALQRAYRYSLAPIQGGAPVFRYTLSCHVELADDQIANDFDFFLHWLAPYSETAGCVGYYREFGIAFVGPPRLLYFQDGKASVLEVVGTPVEIDIGGP